MTGLPRIGLALFNHPVADMAEPGCWSMTDKECESCRACLNKGGFVTFDDFREREGAINYVIYGLTH